MRLAISVSPNEFLIKASYIYLHKLSAKFDNQQNFTVVQLCVRASLHIKDKTLAAKNMRFIHPAQTIALGTILSSVITVALSDPSIAVGLSFSGSLTADDDVGLFDFEVDNANRFSIRTLSYGGGVLDDGTEVAAGGFDPILTLFDGSGNLIAGNDDSGGQIDPATGSAYDSGLRLTLDPGNYTVAVTQFDNFLNGSHLTDGFFREGEPSFTSEFGCSAGQFCDVNGDSRTDNWVAQVRVPEPSTAVASGLLLGLILAKRRKRQDA
ncbi:MAG: DVUA0089 family protein [Thermosynechococcaceae cyanobacterium]